MKYNQLKDEIQRHKPIKVSSADWLDAYYYNTSFCCRVFCCVRKPHSKVDRLYKKSVSKLQDELNLVKLIKDVRKLNNLQHSSFITSAKRDFLLDHTVDNVIDLDSDLDENMEFSLQE